MVEGERRTKSRIAVWPTRMGYALMFGPTEPGDCFGVSTVGCARSARTCVWLRHAAAVAVASRRSHVWLWPPVTLGERVMRIFSSVAMLGSLFVLAIGAGLAQSQETPDDADQEAVMQKWIEFMTPGAEHELLKNRVGKWSVKMEMWVSPDAPVSLSEGTSEMKLVMEGRYLLDSTKSTFQGRPFEGAGITGYDKLKKKFVSVWIDNFGTGFTISTGIV